MVTSGTHVERMYNVVEVPSCLIRKVSVYADARSGDAPPGDICFTPPRTRSGHLLPRPRPTPSSALSTLPAATAHAVHVGHGTATEVQVVTTVRDHTERTERRHMFNRGPPAEPGNQHAHASSNLVLRISVPSRAVLRSRPSPTHMNTCTSTHTPLSQQAALVSCLPQRDTQPALSCALASIPQPLGHVMS